MNKKCERKTTTSARQPNGRHGQNTAKNTEGLKPPWPKGVSGNPGGRPRVALVSHACRELLAQPVPRDPQGRTYAEVIAAMLAAKAIKGDLRAAQEMTDRAEGRARQSFEFQSVALREAFDRLSREDLECYAREGKLPAWFPRDAGVNHE